MAQHPFVAKPALDLSALTADEKLDMIDEIWASLGPDDLALDDATRAEVDRLDREGQ